MSVVYKCRRCDEEMTTDDLAMRGGEIKCIHCGFRVLKKTRVPFVKRVKAV